MDMTDIGVNSYAWTKDGRKVFVTAITTDGEYVVEGMVAQIYGDEVYEDRGETWIEQNLYAKPPVAVLDEEIAAKRAQVAELEKRRQELTVSATTAEREVKDRLAKLQKYNGLELIEDFIEGRITHVVVNDYTGVKAVKFEDLAAYFDGDGWNRKQEGLKLISLYGRSKGDMEFRIHDYPDGSGSTKAIYPFTSEEDATAKRNELILAAVEASRGYVSNNAHTKQPYHVSVAVQNALNHGLEVPDDLMAVHLQHVKDSAAKNKASIEKEIAERQAKLEELEAKLSA